MIRSSTVSVGQPLRLWYEHPAASWMHALPVGNGSLGAMVFGGTELERVALNVDTLWSGGPHSAGITGGPETLRRVRGLLAAGDSEGAGTASKRLQGPISESFQPLGDLLITDTRWPPGTSHHAAAYQRALDLRDGTATTTVSRAGALIRRTTIASAPDQVIATRIEAETASALSLSIGVATPHPGAVISARGADLVCTGHAPAHVEPPHRQTADPVSYRDDAGMAFALVVRVVHEGGMMRTDADGTLRVDDADAVTILVSARSSYAGWDVTPGRDAEPSVAQCLSTLGQAASRSWPDLLSRHRADHAALFERSDFALEIDHDLEALPTDARLANVRAGGVDLGLVALAFAYGRYLLIASSRPGSLPANLQGVWNEHVQPSWSCNFTSNINVEMNYWPAEVTGLGDCALPLLDFIENLAISGARTARDVYGLDGWMTHHNADVWGLTWAVGAGTDNPMWAMWPMGSAWLVSHLVEHAAFSADDAFLAERVWPLLRGVAAFALDFLVTDVNGAAITGLSTSPENTFHDIAGRQLALDVMTTMDIFLLTEVFDNTIDTAARLGIDDPLVGRALAARQRLPRPTIQADGRLLEWSQPYVEHEPGHRHFSHLYGLYPGSSIDPVATPELAAAARRSLEVRLAADGGSTGWSRAWAISLWARLLDGDGAMESIDHLLANFFAPNLFDLHPVEIFQIDGNFGLTAGVAEMLIQSHTDVLRILPALPRSWHSGAVTGLRARGGVEADITWDAGRLTTLTLTALHDRVVYLATPPNVVGRTTVTLVAGSPTLVTFFQAPPASIAPESAREAR
jgi:alpha-L-fucosidase 2